VRIAYVAAGAAGMYCGTCLHDNTVAAALLARGEDVVLIPTYTPLRTDEQDVSTDRIFYGAVSVYLEQKVPFFRRPHRFLDWLLRRRGLLAQVGRFSASTDAHELGSLTLSVLSGEHGHQEKELERLATFLAELRPQVIHLTNAMFLGFARRLREATGAAVVCGLTGEDIFLDQLVEPYRGQVLAEMRRRAGDACAFVATSRYYADRVAELLAVPRERIHVVNLGLSLADVVPRDDGAGGNPFIIGYLARICPEKGLHVLLEAFRRVEQRAPGRAKLRVAGYLGPRDRGYLAEERRKIDAWGLSGAVEILGEVDRMAKLAFLRGLDVLSVPTVYQEPKGRFVLEAFAHGVPVVQPAHGAFPELVEATGGGLLVPPESPEALAEAFLQLMAEPARVREMGRSARAATLERFGSDRLAAETLAVYRAVAGGEEGLR
jgi:glycosyltransferase involved in cell wall biosynthesis